MYRLIIDTALDFSYLALLKDEQILEESYEKGSNNHSETLLPKLETTLKNHNINLKDIEEVYVGIGPGSYTGVRIAVVIGKMIAVMNKNKLYEFSSLASLATSALKECYAFVDCRRGNAYTAHFDYKNNEIVRLSADSMVEVNSYFNGINEDMIIKEGKPNPLLIIKSSVSKLVEDVNSLSPNYLQLVEAERKKLEEKNGNC